MRIVGLLALFFSAFFLTAQSDEVSAQTSKPHFVSFNAGYNFPTGDYKEMEFDTSYLAETNKGYYGSMEFGFYFTKHLGLGINLGAFYNEVNEEDFKAQILADLRDDAEATINTSEWINVYAMLGPYFSVPISRFHIDFKLLGGAMSTHEPLLKMNVTEAGEVKVSKNGEANAIGFGLNYGMHIRVQIVSKLGLRLNVEGFSTQQDIESTLNESSVEIENQYNKRISAINVGAGLVFTFD